MGKKKFFSVIGIMLLSVFWTTASAQTNLQSTYRLWTGSQVTVLPVNGDQTQSYAVVVDSDWNQVTGEVCVNFLWQEAWQGELTNFGQTQKVCSDNNGDLFFPVPSCSGDFFRYLTMWVEGDLASVAHRLFWYNSNTAMPAKIFVVSGSSSLSLGETGDYVFQVLNAWNSPLSGVRVKVIRGNCRTSPEVMLTNSSGCVSFSFTAPSGAVGSEQLRVQVDPWTFLQAGINITWSGSTPPPTGDVASIETVNNTSSEGSLPVFDLAIGQSYSAVFIAKDSSGNPVPGASLTCLYPSAAVTTGADGKVTITLPASHFAGWDSGRINLTADPTIYLEFKITYN